MKIVAAGNTVIPAILTLESLGFEVAVTKTNKAEIFVATRNNQSYSAEDPLTVLGLVKLVELRGEDWRPSDSEIDRTMEKYALG